MSEVMRAVPDEPLLGAIARGWCHPANSHKQMDADLANAIADEVNKWLAAAPAPVDGLVGRLLDDALWFSVPLDHPEAGEFHETRDLLREAAAALQSRDEGDLVCFYEHDFYVLSNFSSFRLQWSGHDFDTSEHAYHWEKFNGADPEVQSMILECRSAHEAFKLAESQKLLRRQDWDNVKVDVMRKIIRAKAEQHEYVMRKLLATGNRRLVEDSWRDDFWGWGPNKDGKNMLGKLWMELRDSLPTPPRKP